jgi:RNA polymerase sigma factor (sigma-70 family)
MIDAPDSALLEQFAKNESEEAFTEIVRRHIGLVHSVALRHTQNAQHAEEITQAVFIILARKASSLGPKSILSGWLYHTARLTAANFQRAEFRRVRREQEVFMQSPGHDEQIQSAWRELSPLLEEAMSKLGTTDRDAIVLRFFENKSLREVGTAMGMEERAAQKRVARGLEKLRAFFSKRGLTLSVVVIGGTIAANSVQAAPATLVTTVAATAVKSTTAAASTLTLVKGVL